MIKGRNIGLYLFGIILITSSCIETIELSNDTSAKQYIAINGQITNYNESYVVTVSKSGNASSYSDKISDANVEIFGSNGYVYELNPVNNGRYESGENEPPGVIGAGYFLVVTLQNGEIYQSSMEQIHSVSPIEEVTFEYVKEPELNELLNIVDKKRVKISVLNNMHVNPAELFYKWDVTGEYEFRESEALTDIYKFTNVGPVLLTCFVEDLIHLGEVHVFDATDLIGQSQFSREIKSIDVDYKFAFNYCVHVRQQSLTQEAYQFWDKVEGAINMDGGLFEKTPGNIIGNIHNVNDPNEKVLGYFYASAVVEKKLFISPDDVGNPVSPCYVIDDDFTAECMECLEIENSRRGIPEYWPR